MPVMEIRHCLASLIFKSRLPTKIPGQQVNKYVFKTPSAWAEGVFLSSMKRVGQALEIRMYIDTLFDENEDALIILCGDFNADLDEVPDAAVKFPESDYYLTQKNQIFHYKTVRLN